MLQASDIPEVHKRQRKNLKKKGVHQKVQYKVAVLYASHAKKPSAAIASQICEDFMTVLNTGAVQAQSEAEYVENGERLPGGTAESQAKELAYGIKQRVVAKAYASKPIKQWMRRRDRCAAQFQGAKAFKRVQDFKRNCGVDLKDCSPPAMEGKWLCDGYGNRPARIAEQNSHHPEDESWKPTVRDFSLFVASKMLVPTKATKFSQGRWGPTEYFHAFYPESAFEDETPAVKTWSGSDECHYFHGKYNDGNDDELIRRKKLCSCDPCFAGRYHNCMSNDLDNGLWYGYKETKRLVNQQVREVASTRSAATFENLKGWKIFKNPSAVVPKGNVVAVRVHNKDRGQTGEQYYLAKVTGPLRELKEGGMYEGNWYDRGFFVFEMTWFHYKGTSQLEGKKSVGDRHYVLGTQASDKCTMQLNGVVTGVDCFKGFKATKKVKGRDKVYVLSTDIHDAIMTLGSLSS